MRRNSLCSSEINGIAFTLTDSNHGHDQFLIPDLVHKSIPRAPQLDLVAILHNAQAIPRNPRRFKTWSQLLLELLLELGVQLVPLAHRARKKDELIAH